MTLKRYITGILITLSTITCNLNGQFISRDNYTGYWSDINSWVGNNFPGLSTKKINIDCYGNLTAINCIDINLDTLSVHDTLIINGNLSILNSSTLIIDSDAIAFIFGDLEIKNQSQVINKGTLIIAGNFEIVGSPNVGGFQNSNGLLFIFDKTPKYPEGGNYIDLSCSNPEYFPDSCAFGSLSDLNKTELSDYYHSLPYSQQELNSEGNACDALDIIASDKLLCVDDTTEYFLLSVGINPADTIQWDFGVDAVPQKAFGFGPHNVVYQSTGAKNISVDIISRDTTLKETGMIRVQDYPITGELFTILNNDSVYFPFGDSVCMDSSRLYAVNGSSQSKYLWKVPVFDIHTFGISELALNWNTDPGEYTISVQEIAEAGCPGTISEQRVIVKDCAKDELLTKRNYAFSPNNDGINDTWYIDGIEDYPEARIVVFDRRGKQVFKSQRNYINDWDGTYNGKKLPLDSYFYIIDLKYYHKETIKGIVTILPIELN